MLGSQTQQTAYCGRRHRLDDGAPLNHACRVLAPEFLCAERDGCYELAASLLERMALELHPGAAQPRDAAQCAE